MSSIFTQIISGKLPCYKIYEDELTFSFLALDQVNLGHTLVIPKNEIDHWLDLPEEDYIKVHLNAQKIGRAIKQATGCPRVGTIVAGFEVHHFHLHLIPAWSISDLTFSRAQRRSPDEMIKVQSEIIKFL